MSDQNSLTSRESVGRYSWRRRRESEAESGGRRNSAECGVRSARRDLPRIFETACGVLRERTLPTDVIQAGVFLFFFPKKGDC
jgi:hypothetical protein